MRSERTGADASPDRDPGRSQWRLLELSQRRCHTPFAASVRCRRLGEPRHLWATRLRA